MVKKKTTKKTTKKQPGSLSPSDIVETPLIVWLRSDIDRLPPDMLARLMAAVSEVCGVVCSGVDVSASNKVIN